MAFTAFDFAVLTLLRRASLTFRDLLDWLLSFSATGLLLRLLHLRRHLGRSEQLRLLRVNLQYVLLEPRLAVKYLFAVRAGYVYRAELDVLSEVLAAELCGEALRLLVGDLPLGLDRDPDGDVEGVVPVAGPE